MPKWISSEWYKIEYGYETWESSDINWFTRGASLRATAPDEALTQALNNLVRQLEREQYQIKSVLPLTTGIASYQYKDWGDSSFGYGFGITPHSGFIVLAQKEEEVSEEEFLRRKKICELREHIEGLIVEYSACLEAVEADQHVATSVEERKGLLWGKSYNIGMREFSSEREALSYLQQILPDIEQRRRQLKAVEIALQNAEEELHALQAIEKEES